MTSKTQTIVFIPKAELLEIIGKAISERMRVQVVSTNDYTPVFSEKHQTCGIEVQCETEGLQ